MNFLTKISFFLLICLPILAIGQDVTKVKGIVIDAQTQEPLPFVDVYFKGSNVGAVTDFDGAYSIETKFPTNTLVASFVGYADVEKEITKGEKQVVDFAISQENEVLETVNIVAKKEKYSKKNNPAIDLSQKVIENSYKNSIESEDFYKYHKQEKIRMDFNNITEKLLNRPVIKNLKFVREYIDTSKVNGRPLLPFFIKENLSHIHYKKKDKVKKEVRYATKVSKVKGGVDANTVTDVMDALYQDINIYKGQISLLSQQFASPFHPSGKDFYRYYIMDTTEVKGVPAIQLAFIPAVKGNKGFMGDVYISDDGNYTVLKVDMGIVKDINLNFVRDLRITQEFKQIGERYVKTFDEIIVDYAPLSNGIGVYGTRTVKMDDFDFEEPKDKSVFNKLEKIITLKDAGKKTEVFWENNRIEALEEEDAKVYELSEELGKSKTFNTLMYLGNSIQTGYLPLGPIAIGDVSSFYSFNSIDGTNLRFGGETTFDFSKKVELKGSITRALKAKIWKYQGSFKYAFNEDYKTNPKHYLLLFALKNSEFPGQDLANFGSENVLFSFNRGDATRMLLSSQYFAEYKREFEGYSYRVRLNHKNRSPWGNMDFGYTDLARQTQKQIANINTSEVHLTLRYAPNEQYIQGKSRRSQLYNKYPIFRLDVLQGIKGVFGSDYNYTKVKLDVFKHIPWTFAGDTNINLQAGYIFGDLPYILQFIPRGNQTYTSFWKAFNMMNFMEFSADKFVSLNIEHFGDGVLFNRIPLFRRLKLREAFVIKGYYGGMRDSANPNLNPDLIQFPTLNGQPTTYVFDKLPYLEGSVGITNIFKLLRIDLVYRMTYLDNVNVPTLFGVKGLGIRGGVRVGF